MTKNIFLFYGEEDFLIDEEIKKLVGSGSLNIETFDGLRGPMDKIINSIASVSLLLGERVVIVKDPWFLKTQRANLPAGRQGGARSEEVGEEGEEGEEGKGAGDKGIEQLAQVLGSLAGGVRVVFVVYGNADRRKKLFKVIEKLADVREFKPYAEWEQEKLESWIIRKVNSSGKKIGGGAAELLMDISGASLRALSSEIDKLVTYVGDRGSIEESDVKAVASSGEISAYSLVSALRDRNTHSSIEALTRLIRDNVEPVPLIGLMASQFRMLLQVKSLKDARLSPSQISQRLGANPYFVRKCSENSHHYSLAEMKNILELLHNADLKIKTGYGSPRSILEMTIIEILSKEGADSVQYSGSKNKQ